MSAGIKSEIITLREGLDLFIQRHKFMSGSEKTPSSETPNIFIFKWGIYSGLLKFKNLENFS